jgi:hypothetical protein
VADPERIVVEGDESISTFHYSDPMKKLETIDRVAPGARILITLRRQSGALKSLYQKRILRDWSVYDIETLRKTENGREAYQSLNYLPVVSECFRLFGPERVLVLLHDDLRLDRTAWLARVDRFFGLREGLAEYVGGPPVNTSLSPISVNLLRSANFLYSRTVLVRRGPRPPKPAPTVPSEAKQDFEADASGYLNTLRFHRRAGRYVLEPLDRMALYRLSSLLNVETVDTTPVMEEFRESNARLSDVIGVDLVARWYRERANGK